MITRDEAILLTQIAAYAMSNEDMRKQILHHFGSWGFNKAVSGCESLADYFKFSRVMIKTMPAAVKVLGRRQ